MKEVQLRASNALKKLATEHDGKTIAITTHAGVIRALQCLWQKLPLTEMKTIPWVENASISIIIYNHEEFNIKEIGKNKHLQTQKTNLPNNM